MEPARPWHELLEEAPNVVIFDAQGHVLAVGNQARQRLGGDGEPAPWWGLEPPPPGLASVTREHQIGNESVRIIWKRAQGSAGTFIAAAVV